VVGNYQLISSNTNYHIESRPLPLALDGQLPSKAESSSVLATLGLQGDLCLKNLVKTFDFMTGFPHPLWTSKTLNWSLEQGGAQG
jgi:hypothetical protein